MSGSKGGIGQREIWIQLNGTVVMLNSAWDLQRDVMPVALLKLLQGFRRRAGCLFQWLVELSYRGCRLAQLAAQLRRRDAQFVHDVVSAGSVLLDASHRIPGLA